MTEKSVKTREKTKIPKFRFGGFGGEWEEKELGEVFNRITEKNKENNKNVLTISAQQGLVNQKEYFTKSVSAKDVTGYYLLYKDDFAYNKSSSKGYPMGAIKSLKIYDKGVVSTLYICFRIIEENDSRYFQQYFDAGKINRGISKIAQEGARNHGLLNMAVVDFFEGISFLVPQKEEQKKIADFLGGVDVWIENLEGQKENLENYKKGMMQKIFSQEIRFKNDDRKSFPAWEEKKLGEICEKESSNISANSIVDNTGKYKIYGAAGVLKKIDFFTEDVPYISIVKDGAGVGRGLLCEKETSTLGTLDKIYPNAGISLYFLFLILSQIKFRRYKIGSTIPHIYFRDYQKEKINFPSLPEQQKIADFLSSIDELIRSKSDQVRKAKEWKKGLMQKMFV